MTSRMAARKHLRAAGAVALVSSVVAATGAGCGSGNGVVGGSCASGYTQCGLACVDLETDPGHCGACGVACAQGVACREGKCEGVLLPDGAVLEDGSVDHDADDLLDGQVCDASDPVCRPSGVDASSEGGGDATIGDASDAGPASDAEGGEDATAASDAEGGSITVPDGDTLLPDGAIQEPDGAIVCEPPFNTAANCGACGHACTGSTPVCELVDGGFGCAPVCEAPLTDCSGQCVDLARDPNNCGTCGTVCASQYCYLATCQGSIPGNAIVIGHDFAAAKATDQETKLLVNAVFYNPPSVRLLSFEHYAGAAAVANAKSLLATAATANHYTLATTVTDNDSFVTTGGLTVQNFDAILVWDQPAAPAGTMGALGSAWAPNLARFAQQGGIVIALDADQGVGEMPAFLTNAAILAVTSHAQVAAGTEIDVPLAGLSIARGMLTEYGADSNTASFTTSEPSSPTTLFVANVNGQPSQLVAVQKITH